MQTQKHHAVIFDVDGLIINTEELYWKTFNKTLGDYGFSLTRREYSVCVGHPVEDNCRYAVDRYRLETSPGAFCKIWMERFERAISDPEKIALMPGFLDLLAHVRRKPYRLGIASATQRPRMEKTLRNGLLSRLEGLSSLNEIFKAMLSGSDIQRPKPAPDIYLLTAERLGVSPRTCLAFEDSEAGVRSAKAAGMDVIAVPNLFTAHQDHSAADAVLAHLMDAVVEGHV